MTTKGGRRVLTIAAWASIAWTGVIAGQPYLRYRGTRYQGPPDIVEYDDVDDSLVKSRTVQQYINPLGNRYWGDTRSITFNNLRDRKSGKLLSDAEILKRLCIGFWGGTIFSYEQSFLRGFPKDRVHFELERRKERGDYYATSRWGQQHFELEKGDHLYQTFQVLDMKIRPPCQEKVAVPRPERGSAEQYDLEGFQAGEESSYIDFGYGSSRPGSKFAGVHRFSVTRLPPETVQGSSWQTQRQNDWLEDDGGRVRVTFESYTCSPTPGGGTMMEWGWKYHKKYSRMLFSTGVAAVVRGYGRSAGS